MSAFVNGALSAIEKISKFLDSLDPENHNELSDTLRRQLTIYEIAYREYDNRVEISDDT